MGEPFVYAAKVFGINEGTLCRLMTQDDVDSGPVERHSRISQRLRQTLSWDERLGIAKHVEITQETGARICWF